MRSFISPLTVRTDTPTVLMLIAHLRDEITVLKLMAHLRDEITVLKLIE